MNKTKGNTMENLKAPLNKNIRNKILEECAYLKYQGDAGISSNYFESTDQELIDKYSWVLEDI